jgi:hypothetical protein
LFDGTGDYLTAADSADWQLDGGSNSNSWTIDFWVRFNGDPSAGDASFLQQYVDVNNYWVIYFFTDTLVFQIRSAGSFIVNLSNAWNPASATWYHITFVKNGTTGYLMFVDGTQIGTTQTDVDPMPNFAGGVQLGRRTNTLGASAEFNGWLDEFRISKGIARWTANFTPPTGEY